MAAFSNRIHLVRRFSELARSPAFGEWLRHNPSTRWHETHANDAGELDVIIQSDDDLSVFAARVIRQDRNDDEDGWEHRISQEQVFRPEDLRVSKTQAVAAVVEAKQIRLDSILTVRPTVEFRNDGAILGWLTEVETDQGLVAHSVLPDKPIVSSTPKAVEPWRSDAGKVSVDALVPPMSDWLASNDCHHLDRWRTTARSMVGQATSNSDRAKRIWSGVRRKMRYDANIKHIEQFTHSDNLSIARYRWAGICDEWAVVQVTLLRALGIPANIKFLIWTDGIEPVGHACIEWKDGNVWRHMDSLWNSFDDKSIYRANGAQNITVMDASSPRDSRSTAPAWGVPDVSGDQKFYPYGDFIISPSYPGSSRSGYSF